MATHFRLIATVGACAFVAGLAGVSVGAQAATKSLNDGVYTEAQAARGQKTFEGNCTSCHETERFKAEFFNSWKNEPVFGMFEMISGTMPADNPGGLRPQDYADIISYFLKLNEYPTGAAELPAAKDVTSQIKIEPSKSH